MYLDETLRPFFQARLNHRNCPSWAEYTVGAGSRAPNRKHYISEILLRGDFEQMILRLLLIPRERDLIRPNTAVTQIVRAGDSAFRLHTANGETINTQHVVLGCGRSSHAFLRRAFASLGVTWEQPHQDVGIRLEAPSSLFTEDFTYQGDPKYKFVHSPYGTSRTFCGCHGGIIVPVKFGHSFYADGAFGDHYTDSSNLAFMVRSRETLATQALEEWCTAMNTSAGGSLLLGKVPLGFTEVRELVSTIMALVPLWPTVGETSFAKWTPCRQAGNMSGLAVIRGSPFTSGSRDGRPYRLHSANPSPPVPSLAIGLTCWKSSGAAPYQPPADARGSRK